MIGIRDGLCAGISYGLLFGLGGGVSYGSLLALSLGGLDQASIKRLNPDYSEMLLGLHQVQVFTVRRSFDEAFEACISSVLELRKCQITQQNKEIGAIRADTGMTWKSFGEKIMLTVSSADDHTCTVTISSKPRIPTALMDYGKNVENMRLIIDSLSNRVAIIETPRDETA